ncbi:4'-phosphopantetheinyl transferase family protein [Brevibacillus sp. 179-C 1.1 NHS]|uniref:4'-phosphopantetheinyl transferase family protein n=1 Tax=Brevibacillus sp. 179-C 1.1 NHS TaxID=3235177 RepID=UPI0039A02BC9
MKQSLIQVYWVALPDENPLEQIRHRSDLLDPEEMTTFQRYRVPFKKVEFLTGRVLIKELLGRVLRIPAERVRLRKNDYGKLFVHHALLPPEYQRAISFNLSHTDGMVVCVLALEEEAGIDVEKIAGDHLNVMPQVFTPAEIDYVEAMDRPDRKQEAFYRIWTRKEAVMKAEGMGFSLPPLSFSVPLMEQPEEDETYSFDTFQPLRSYLVSVAIKKDMPAKRLFFKHNIDFSTLFEKGIRSGQYKEASYPNL